MCYNRFYRVDVPASKMRNAANVAQGRAFLPLPSKAMIELLDIKQVAEYLHVTPDAVFKRVKNGKFPKPFTKPREKYLWTKEVVEEWVRQQVERSGPQNKKLNATVQKRARLSETVRKLKEFGIDWNPEL